MGTAKISCWLRRYLKNVIVIPLGTFFRDADDEILRGLYLAGQARCLGQSFGLIQHIFFILGHLAERLKALLDYDVTGRAGAIATAVVIYLDVVIERGVQNGRSLGDINLDIIR
jgi:hypothetical protein